MDKTERHDILFLVVAGSSTYSRYLPVSKEALRWETHCLDAGYSQVAPGDRYPVSPGDHPDGYAREVVTGRVLAEFQVVYITRGSGTFRAERFGETPIRAGDLFLLFPGILHAFRPNPDTGWHEYWVGFAGEYPARLCRNGLFTPENPVHHVGLSQELTADFEQILRLCRQQPPAFQIRLGAHVVQILAHIHAANAVGQTSAGDDRPVDLAREMIAERLDDGIDVSKLAGELGMSYTRLLHVFRIYTGMTPYQYFVQLRVHRSKELLRDPERTVKEIAAVLGFDNQYYFSRIFKRKTGYSPVQWRRLVKSGA